MLINFTLSSIFLNSWLPFLQNLNFTIYYPSNQRHHVSLWFLVGHQANLTIAWKLLILLLLAYAKMGEVFVQLVFITWRLWIWFVVNLSSLDDSLNPSWVAARYASAQFAMHDRAYNSPIFLSLITITMSMRLVIKGPSASYWFFGMACITFNLQLCALFNLVNFLKPANQYVQNLIFDSREGQTTH